jgi:hypothetical protein
MMSFASVLVDAGTAYPPGTHGFISTFVVHIELFFISFVLLVVDSYMLNILYDNFKRKLELITRTAICEFSSKAIRHYDVIF